MEEHVSKKSVIIKLGFSIGMIIVCLILFFVIATDDRLVVQLFAGFPIGLILCIIYVVFLPEDHRSDIQDF